ncbi:hypothetical protein NicSoilC12_07140 [Arthrobacter sp. NicSoilC12]|nr:hypothetical protein NicSoilC12_07140 [Arthrobacter sp. NicSoilC12]
MGEGGSLCALGGDRVVASHDVRGAGHEGQSGDGSADGKHRRARAAATGAVWTRGGGATGDRSRGPWPTRHGVSCRDPVRGPRTMAGPGGVRRARPFRCIQYFRCARRVGAFRHGPFRS